MCDIIDTAGWRTCATQRIRFAAHRGVVAFWVDKNIHILFIYSQTYIILSSILKKISSLRSFLIISIYTANLAASFTLSRIQSHIESFDDLINQNTIEYAPILNSTEMSFFERMANIEEQFFAAWKRMAVDEPTTLAERIKFTVFEYPIGDRYVKIWNAIKQTGMPKDLDEGVARVRMGNFALLGQSTEVAYKAMVNCDLTEVGDDFAEKPLAIAVQQGSALKNEFDSM